MKLISKLLGPFAPLACVLTLALSLSTAPQAFAASGNWNTNTSSTWNTAANWTPVAVPGTAAGDVIGLNFNITAPRTVTINTAVTLGTLNIGDTDGSNTYTLALTSGSLTLNNSGSGAVINMLATSAGDTISAPFTLADNLTINNNSAVNGFEARNLTISGNITESGGARTLTKTGTGAVILSGTNSYTGGSSVTGGALIFRNTASLPSTGTATFASGTTIGLGVGAAGFFSAANVDSAFGNTLANTSLNANTAIGIDTTSGNFSYTYGGGAANARSLVKYGANTLTISGLSTTAANNYTGTTVIDQGTLAISGDASLTGNITFGATRGSNQVGSLDLTNSSLTAGALTVQTDSTSNNTITIGAGKTLTTNGNVAIGPDVTGISATNPTTKLSVAGTTSADGTWNVVSSNGTFRVGTSTGAARASQSTLDMSGLANFSAELRTGGSGSAGGNFTVGSTEVGGTGTGNTLILAGNSTISAAILNISSTSGPASTQALLLGSGTQVINAGNINMSTGTRDSSSLSFNGGTGTIKIRGTAGGELDRANLTMLTGTTTNATVASTFNVAGHAADLMLGTVKVLDSTGSFTSAFNYTATFSFDTGTLDATSFLIGSKSAGNASAITLAGIVNIGNGTTNAINSATMGTVSMASVTTTGTLSTGAVTGTLNIAGSATTVGITSLEVAKYTSANTTATATGAVNISGGATTVTNGITLATRTTAGIVNGSLNLTGGNLSVGTAGVSGTNGIYTTGIGGATTTLTLNGGSLNLNGNAIGGAGQLITNLNFQSGTLSNVSQINNGAGLTKTTGGTLILSGNNTYTGTTTVSAGTLTLDSVTAMQNSVFDTTGAGTLSMGAITTPTLGGLSGGTNFSPTNYGSVTALTLNPQTGVTATYSGTLPDGAAAMTLSKTGLGTQVLSGLSGTAASNYTGLTTIDQGTLALSAASSNLTGGLTFGATATGGVNTGTLDLSSGSATFAGGLTVQTNSATANTISIGSGQTLTTGGTVVIGANGGTTGGYNPVSKLTVSGDSWTHTSSAGTFRVGNNSTAGGSNQRAANSVLDLSGLAQFSADVRTTGLGTGGSFIVGDASNGANGSGELLTLSANNTISAGSITVQSGGAGGTNRLALGSGANVFNTTTLTVGGGQRDDGTLNFAGGTGTFILRGGLGNGTANVNVGNLNSSSTGSRTSLIDFSGHSSDLAIGTLYISDTGNSLTSVVNHVATFTFDSGTMTATGNVGVGRKQSNSGSSAAIGTITANLNIGNGTTNLTNTSTLATTLVIANNLDDVGTSAGNLNIAGSATTVNFTSAANDLVIAQSNNGGNATGAVNISGGATTITRGITLANLTAGAGVVSGTINLTGGSLTLGTAGITTTAGTTSTVTLNGGSLNMNNQAIGGANAITNLNFQSGTLSNVSGINNGAGLTKTTGGTLILSGTNTYTGETLVSTGTLIVNGTSSNSAFTVASGATLGGSGTVNGATTVQSGGTLSPGNSPGLASYANLTLDTGAIFKFELATNVSTGRGTNFDGVDILTGGSLAISTGVNSNLVFNAVGSDVDWNDAFWSANQSWLVFDLADGGYASNVPVVNSLSVDSLSQTLGSVHSSASFSYAISGGDVYLNYNAVPEPATWALLAFSLTTVMVLRRRRNS